MSLQETTEYCKTLSTEILELQLLCPIGSDFDMQFGECTLDSIMSTWSAIIKGDALRQFGVLLLLSDKACLQCLRNRVLGNQTRRWESSPALCYKTRRSENREKVVTGTNESNCYTRKVLKVLRRQREWHHWFSTVRLSEVGLLSVWNQRRLCKWLSISFLRRRCV